MAGRFDTDFKIRDFKIVKFVKFGPLIFLSCKSTCDLTDVPASIYEKMDARPFDPIHDVLRCLSLVQSLLKGRNAPIWRKREQTHMRLLETDRLTPIISKTVGCYSPPVRSNESTALKLQ